MNKPTGLSHWQRGDGFPSDAYFTAVVDAIQARWVLVADWWRDVDWGWTAEIARESYLDGPVGYAEHGLFIGWRCDEMDEPQHATDFTARGEVNTGWHWVPHTKPGALGDFIREFDELAWLAEPEEVADAVADLVRGSR